MNLRGTISEYERKILDKGATPKKDLFKAKITSNNLERDMTVHQTALHMMSP